MDPKIVLGYGDDSMLLIQLPVVKKKVVSEPQGLQECLAEGFQQVGSWQRSWHLHGGRIKERKRRDRAVVLKPESNLWQDKLWLTGRKVLETMSRMRTKSRWA